MIRISVTLLLFPYWMLCAQNVQKEIVYTIEEGHEIVTNENRFALGCGSTDFCLVTKWKDEFYAIHNGKKSGPYADMHLAFSMCRSVEGSYIGFESRVFQEDGVQSQFVVYDDDAKVTLRKGSTKYGPFDMLQMFWMSPDKNNFYAVCLLNNETYFVSSLYGSVKLNGYVTQAHKSACGSNSLVVVSTGKNMMQEIMNADLSEMSEEQLQGYFEQLIQTATEESNPNVFVVTADNKTFGPYAEQMMDGPQYGVSSKTNWYMVYDKKLIVNGIQMVDLEEQYVNSSQIWISTDGKQIAWATWDKLVFMNGNSYEYPLHIHYCLEGNKYKLVWICFDGKSFIKYKCDF